MVNHDTESTARTLVADGKGILAGDETLGTVSPGGRRDRPGAEVRLGGRVCQAGDPGQELMEHKQYIARYGDDMLEITGWKWGDEAGASVRVRSTEADNA